MNIFNDFIASTQQESSEMFKVVNNFGLPKIPTSLPGLNSLKGRLFKAEEEDVTDTTDITESSPFSSDSETSTPPLTKNPNDTFARRGVSYTLKKPFTRIFTNSEITTSLEQTENYNGDREYLGQVNVELGPVVSDLPWRLGRHSVLTRIDLGGRGRDVGGMKPYSSTTVVSKDVVPITGGEGEGVDEPICLASR